MITRTGSTPCRLKSRRVRSKYLLARVRVYGDGAPALGTIADR